MLRQALENRIRQPARFRPEHDGIAGLEADLVERPSALRRQRKDAGIGERIQAGGQIIVLHDPGHLSVIEACPPDPGFVQDEAQWTHEV